MSYNTLDLISVRALGGELESNSKRFLMACCSFGQIYSCLDALETI